MPSSCPAHCRDSLYFLDGLLEQQAPSLPDHMTDTAGYFDLFRLLGSSSAPASPASTPLRSVTPTRNYRPSEPITHSRAALLLRLQVTREP